MHRGVMDCKSELKARRMVLGKPARESESLVFESGRLLDMTGGSGQQETALRWMAETGELGLSQPENKYLARLELRVQPEDRARLEASASYDGGRSWETLGQVIGGDGQTRGYLLHLRPRRCRQVRLRLQGTGRCRVFSMSAVYEKGSDGP